jgi:hypothetical protein
MNFTDKIWSMNKAFYFSESVHIICSDNWIWIVLRYIFCEPIITFKLWSYSMWRRYIFSPRCVYYMLMKERKYCYTYVYHCRPCQKAYRLESFGCACTIYTSTSFNCCPLLFASVWQLKIRLSSSQIERENRPLKLSVDWVYWMLSSRITLP